MQQAVPRTCGVGAAKGDGGGRTGCREVEKSQKTLEVPLPLRKAQPKLTNEAFAGRGSLVWCQVVVAFFH